jgi:hypothetical protein
VNVDEALGGGGLVSNYGTKFKPVAQSRPEELIARFSPLVFRHLAAV